VDEVRLYVQRANQRGHASTRRERVAGVERVAALDTVQEEEPVEQVAEGPVVEQVGQPVEPVQRPKRKNPKLRTSASLRYGGVRFDTPRQETNTPKQDTPNTPPKSRTVHVSDRPVTRKRVSSANYCAVSKNPKLGFIDMGRSWSGRSLLAHGDEATNLRQGGRLNMRRPDQKQETSVQIQYITRSGYCNPGHKVRTSLVGVSDQDWERIFKRNDA